MLPDLLAFALGSAVLVWLSRKPLRAPGRHGFYRFFAWECILVLVILNREPWGESPYSWHQITSWILMLLSIALVLEAARELRVHGRADTRREDGSLYEFEKTTHLVTGGLFGLIRHPMYASLLALTWGAYFQAPSLIGTAIATLATGCLWLTAKADEQECLAYFGPIYAEYMQRTRRFIPYFL